MKRILMLILLVAMVALSGCLGSSDIHVNTDQITGCLAACMSDTLLIDIDGKLIPVVPADFEEWVFK